METIHTIEKTAGNWFKQFPHLNKKVAGWIADNAWWLVLIGVILGALAAISMLPILFGASLILAALSPLYNINSGAVTLNLWINLILLVVIVVLEAKAVNPLRLKQKTGWDLMFRALLVAVISSLISTILLMSLAGLTGAVLTALVGGYVLFETRSYFVKPTKSRE